MRTLFAIVAFLGAASAALADGIVYVKASGSNTEPYDTEETAATTLNTAVTYANAQGIRKVKVVGTVTNDTQLTLANVEICGDGWTNAEITHTAGKVAPVFTINANVLIHGIKFTSTSAYLRGYYHLNGADSIISNCSFSALQCKSLQSNQEIAGHATAGLITHCLISGNHTNNSGAKDSVPHAQGVLDLSGTARMANCIFSGNYHGSNYYAPCEGLLVISGNAVLENCVVYGNYTLATAGNDATASRRPRRGGGISVYSGSPTIRNCIIRNNKMPVEYDSSEKGTIPATVEGDIYIVSGATPTIENCNLPEGQVPEGAVNCQTDDPLWTDAAGGDFHIAANSPCVDMGKIVAGMDATDYYGNARVMGYGVDIGINEVTLPTPELDIEANVTNATGRQTVNFTAVDRADGSALPTGLAFSWTLDGVEQASTVSTMSAMLEPGTHTVEVSVGNRSVTKTDFITIEEQKGVEFLLTAHPYAGFQTVDLSGAGSGGTTIHEDATYTWYWRKEGEEFPATACATGNDLTDIRFDQIGTYYFKLVVLNYDGKGGSIESVHTDPEVTVTAASVSLDLSGNSGEGRTLIDLSSAATGFTFDEDAVFEWRWTKEGAFPETAQMTGNPVTGTFRPGTWSVRLIVRDADGGGTSFTNTLTDAIVIADGADYYVAPDGSDAWTGTKDQPYKTLTTALAQPSFGTDRKTIEIVGTVTQNAKVNLADVEIYGGGWDESVLHHTAGYVTPAVFVIGANVFIHDIKFTAGSNYLRALYTMSDSSSVISNCWFSGLYCATLQNEKEIAGRVSAGLVTHCLFSGIHSDNGGGEAAQVGLGVLHLLGTAQMRNCIFTGNSSGNNTRGPIDGLLTVSGEAVLENCVIYDNWAYASEEGDKTTYYRPRRGAGICVRSGSPTIRNCIVRKNLKPHTPSDGKYPTETEEDIYNPTEEGNFYIAEGATPQIQGCNVPSADQIPSCATGCQTGDPLFTDPDNAVLGDRDFHIDATSPCRDAGVSRHAHWTMTDYSGELPRRRGERTDIGAHEYPDCIVTNGAAIMLK